MKHILMLSAENGALYGGKVGGMADVIRDVPVYLSKIDFKVDVVTPSYGFLHTKNRAQFVTSFSFYFRNRLENATLYKVVSKEKNVNYFLIDHNDFYTGDGVIYSYDPENRPFATDATKFAIFCTAVAELIKIKNFNPDIIHLHDWHTTFLIILLKYHKIYKKIKDIKIVFTIHNLALQGVRPFENDSSSLYSWFKEELILTKSDKERLTDPRWNNCFNPMAIGIRFSDIIHVVSPSYAKEILEPSNPPLFYGGEGLEKDLKVAFKNKKLKGILNGCPYPDGYKSEKLGFKKYIEKLLAEIETLSPALGVVPTWLFVAYNRLKDIMLEKKEKIILTSISRVTEQKMLLLKSITKSGKYCIDELLELIKDKAIYIMIGNGEKEYEKIFIEAAMRHKNFIFINGYSERCSSLTYANGDLFIMPSSFEPCGISQMLAMRDGQPCIVHEVGGLKDTILKGVNGFSFNGETIFDKLDNFLSELKNAIDIKLNKPEEWNKICENAKRARFRWEDSIKKYVEELYLND